jgi:UDP-N-acetylmuramate dehydrogenase
VRVWDRIKRNYVLMSANECQFGYRTSVFKQDIDRFVILEVTFQLPIGSQTNIHFEQLAQALGADVGESVSEHRIRDAVLHLRASKGMVIDQRDPDSRSVGSFFINPYVCADHAAALPADCPRYPVNADVVKLSAAWLIENAGIERGFTLGTDACISRKHALALVNSGAAKTDDILDLARHVRAVVKEKFGVDLEPEPRLIGCEL